MNDAASLLKRVRSGAGLSQRELARRAATAQSVVARIESGEVSPSLHTLAHLARCAGFEVRWTATASAAGSLDDVPRILALTPEQRLLELRNAARFFAAARAVADDGSV